MLAANYTLPSDDNLDKSPAQRNNLKRLDASHNEMPLATLLKLFQLPKLNTLNLSNVEITDFFSESDSEPEEENLEPLEPDDFQPETASNSDEELEALGDSSLSDSDSDLETDITDLLPATPALSLESLDLSGGVLNEYLLVTLLPSIPTLRHLNISDMEFYGEFLSSALSSNQINLHSLESLNLSNCYFDDQSLFELLVRSAPKLTSLDISENEILDDENLTINNAPPNIRLLSVKNQSLTLTNLANMLKLITIHLKAVETLDISGCHFTFASFTEGLDEFLFPFLQNPNYRTSQLTKVIARNTDHSGGLQVLIGAIMAVATRVSTLFHYPRKLIYAGQEHSWYPYLENPKNLPSITTLDLSIPDRDASFISAYYLFGLLSRCPDVKKLFYSDAYLIGPLLQLVNNSTLSFDSLVSVKTTNSYIEDDYYDYFNSIEINSLPKRASVLSTNALLKIIERSPQLQTVEWSDPKSTQLSLTNAINAWDSTFTLQHLHSLTLGCYHLHDKDVFTLLTKIPALQTLYLNDITDSFFSDTLNLTSDKTSATNTSTLTELWEIEFSSVIFLTREEMLSNSVQFIKFLISLLKKCHLIDTYCLHQNAPDNLLLPQVTNALKEQLAPLKIQEKTNPDPSQAVFVEERRTYLKFFSLSKHLLEQEQIDSISMPTPIEWYP